MHENFKNTKKIRRQSEEGENLVLGFVTTSMGRRKCQENENPASYRKIRKNNYVEVLKQSNPNQNNASPNNYSKNQYKSSKVLWKLVHLIRLI